MLWHPSRVRWMAIDHGTKRIGFAFCDPGETLATPVAVWPNDGTRTVEALAALAREESVEAVIVGLPRHADGVESATAPAVRKFAAALEETLDPRLPMRFWGEELTSVEAERLLARRGIPPAERRRRLDALAAAIMLEDFLADRRVRGIPLDSALVPE